MTKDSIADLSFLKGSLSEIEKKLGYTFTNKTLLLEAFTHRSIINELVRDSSSFLHNERLEFLGDAVINLYVASQLYEKYPAWNEGTLSQAKAILVSEESLHKIVEGLGIHIYLAMGRGEILQKSYLLPSIQADLFESIMGAVFLDGGLGAVHSILHAILGNNFFSTSMSKEETNPKAQLQEMLAKSGLSLPEYRLVQEEGPQHDKKFFFSVFINGLHLGAGWGESKKEAQKQAAKEAIEYIKSHGLPHFETGSEHKKR